MAICLSPVLINNPKFEEQLNAFYNGLSDELPSKKIAVPCGKCLRCLQRKRRDWYIRLEDLQKRSSSSLFITLTYDDDTLPFASSGYPSLKLRDVQLFMKRLRKSLPGVSLSYFVCGEYGPSTLRPHYHMLLFNLPLDDYYSLLKKSWTLGHFCIDFASPARLMYVTKYMLPANDSTFNYEKFGCEKPFMRCSKHLGEPLATKSNVISALTNGFIVDDCGSAYALPRYVIDKLPDSDKDRIKASRSAYVRSHDDSSIDAQEVFRQRHVDAWKLKKIVKHSKL